MPNPAGAYRLRRQHISFFRFSPAACEGERGKNGSQQSNKKEEQWRHWIAKYQVWIPSFASLGLPSSVRLNYVLLTTQTRATKSFTASAKPRSSAKKRCLSTACFQHWGIFVLLSAMSAIRWSLLRASSHTMVAGV